MVSPTGQLRLLPWAGPERTTLDEPPEATAPPGLVMPQGAHLSRCDAPRSSPQSVLRAWPPRSRAFGTPFQFFDPFQGMFESVRQIRVPGFRRELPLERTGRLPTSRQ